MTHVRPIQEKRHGPFFCTLNYFPAGKASLRGPITPSLNVSALSVKGEGSTCPVLNTLAPVFQPPHPACFSVPPSCLAFLHFGNTVIGHWLGHLGSTSDSQAPINTDYQVSWFYHSQRTRECVPRLQEVLESSQVWPHLLQSLLHSRVEARELELPAGKWTFAKLFETDSIIISRPLVPPYGQTLVESQALIRYFIYF